MFSRKLNPQEQAVRDRHNQERKEMMSNEDDIGSLVAIRAGIWASASDLPSTIWAPINGEVIQHLLDIYPPDDEPVEQIDHELLEHLMKIIPLDVEWPNEK